MKRFLPLIIFYVLLQGCDPGIPKEIIQPDKMEKVLFDIHLVDGYIGTQTKEDTIKIIASSYYRGIYKKYKIDSALFNSSMNYYYSQPAILNDIYIKIGKKFELENAKYEKLITNELANKNQKNISVVILENLPIDKKQSKIGANPFELSLSLSRY